MCLPGFATAHRELAERYPTRPGRLDRSTGAGGGSSPNTPGCPPAIAADVVHHGGGTVPLARPDRSC